MAGRCQPAMHSGFVITAPRPEICSQPHPATGGHGTGKTSEPATKLLFLVTPSNPLTEIIDIAALAKIAHARDCLLVVDNFLCTPALQQPLALGADIVIHSATR